MSKEQSHIEHPPFSDNFYNYLIPIRTTWSFGFARTERYEADVDFVMRNDLQNQVQSFENTYVFELGFALKNLMIRDTSKIQDPKEPATPTILYYILIKDIVRIRKWE